MYNFAPYLYIFKRQQAPHKPSAAQIPPMPYPLPYILLALFYAALGYLYHRTDDERHRRYVNTGALLAFVLFFGFRGYLLTDWMSYYPYYHDLEWTDILNYFMPNEQGLEPGFALLCMVCKMLSGGSYHFLEFTVTCVFLGLLYRFSLRYTHNISLVLMLFLAFNGVSIVCNLLRNTIAIGIFLNAIPYLEQRRPLPYFGLCLLAMLFHVSALIYVPLYFFLHLFTSRWVYLGVFIVANVAFITRFSIVQQMLEAMQLSGEAAMKADAYTGKMTSGLAVFSIGYLERLLTCTLIILYHDKLKELHNGSGVIVNGVLLFLIMFYFFSEFDVLAHRVSNLFIFGYWIIWLDFIRCFYYENNRRLMAGFIVAYTVIHMWPLNNAPDFLYENVLFGAQSYNERLYYHSRNFHE